MQPHHEAEAQRLFANRVSRKELKEKRSKPDGKETTPLKGGAWARWSTRQAAKKNQTTTEKIKD